jgi:D-alanyl-D-alanine carboxypeptidase
MKRAALMVIAAASLLAGTAVPAATAAVTRPAGSVSPASLTAAINRVMREASIPGAIVGVWNQGMAPYVRAFGVQNVATGQPMSTGLYMRIGSETKTFTVTALLELVDEGKVGLDDPISRYVAGVPDGNTITIRELAEMRSGLYNYSNDPAVAAQIESRPYRQWGPYQLLSYSFRHPLLFQPGTKYYYSNTNTILLGLVIEKVSGLALDTYITRYVLQPDNLSHTVFPSGAQFPSPHAQGYAGLGTITTNWNPSWGWAAGQMISTVNDLHVWADDVATGKLLTPATQRQRLRFLPVPLPGVTAGYGLGLLYDNGWIGHNGSLPGYQSLAIYLPQQKATVVVLVNSDINYRGSSLTTLLGRAITEIISPAHVFTL